MKQPRPSQQGSPRPTMAAFRDSVDLCDSDLCPLNSHPDGPSKDNLLMPVTGKRGILLIKLCLLLLLMLLQAMSASGSCPKKTVTLYANHTKQYLYSPNYPGFYPRPASCSWKIIAAQGDRLVFRFFAFNLEASIFCFRDYFSVVDGHTSFHPEIIFMCGSFSSNQKFTTTEKTAQVEFLALATGPRETGFQVGFWTEDMISAPYKDAEYTYANFIMMAISGSIGVAIVVGFIILLRSHARRKRLDKERDEENLQH